jgi:CHRD domain
MRNTRLLAAIVLSVFAGSMVACGDDDDDEDFVANLTAAAEVNPPAGNPTATGTADLVLEDRVLTVTVDVSGQTTSNITMAHIHGPAIAGVNANIVLDFVPSMTAVIGANTRTGRIVSTSYDLDALGVSATGVLRVEPDVLIDMLNTGQAYVNVHTATNPGGEIRGQIRRD